MGTIGKIARRTFLIGSAAVLGGVAFGYYKYRQPYDNPLEDDLPEGATALTEFVRIDAEGVTVIVPRAEMGQGVMTTLAALVAEELDVSLDKIKVEHGPVSHAYFNAAALREGVPFAATDDSGLARNVRAIIDLPAKFLGFQLTGGSSSVPDAYEKMRVAGAVARETLKHAASRRVGQPVSALKTEAGEIITPDGKRIAYEALAADAAKTAPVADARLKPKSEWKLLGKSQPRVDMVPKCTGSAEFSIDVRLPDMVYASVKMNPYLGGNLRSFDATAARKMRGVIDVIKMSDGGIAVIADNTWRATQAANSVTCEWGKGPYPETTDEMFAAVEKSFAADHMDSRLRDDGDAEMALADKAAIEAEYRVPFLAHATMEPMNAVAWLREGKLDLWAGNQFPTQARADAAAIAGIDKSRVSVHTTVMGGGFGRRVEMDFIKQAVEIAKSTGGRPVKLTWSREEDMTHDTYRPLAIGRLRGAVGDGIAKTMDLSVACPSVLESQLSRIGMPTAGPDLTTVQGAWDQPYNIENYRVTGYKTPALCPVSFWRSVGCSFNGFFHESSIDELAHAAGVDPMAMRLKMISHVPSRKVLEAVAEMSRWDEKLPEGHGRGVAFTLSFGVPTAEVIEVANTPDGIRIEKIFAAVDVGTALDPRNIEAQVQSGIVYGLSAAVQGRITFSGGAVQQSNFHDYDGLRINHIPSIEVRILENAHEIRGIGEPGTPPAAPALANAIFAATGKRLRELPLNLHVEFA